MYVYKISNIKTEVINESLDNKSVLFVKSKKALSVNQLQNQLSKKYGKIVDFVCEAVTEPRSAPARMDAEYAQNEEKKRHLAKLRLQRKNLNSKLKMIQDQITTLENELAPHTELRRNEFRIKNELGRPEYERWHQEELDM